MRHLQPSKPGLFANVGEECPGWSKLVENPHGVQERFCKCGRARIVKITSRGLSDMFLPLFDGETLPVYGKLVEAKEAIECVARGESPPKPSRPRVQPEYRNIGKDAGATSYERTKAWFNSQTKGVQTTSDALTILGLAADATPGEIKSTVRRLKMEFHPDRNPNDDQAAERFRQVVLAAESLESCV